MQGDRPFASGPAWDITKDLVDEIANPRTSSSDMEVRISRTPQLMSKPAPPGETTPFCQFRAATRRAATASIFFE